MIISHKYKMIFIGFPFSASSAITKELYLQYEGKPYLSKHSLYKEFKRHAKEKELQYFMFAVLRNPMEIVATRYVKMKKDVKGNFHNKKLFKENGGHITRRQRDKHRFIHENNATFQQFFLRFYKRPYDNISSSTIDKCNYIIRYEKIDKDYIDALKKAGVDNPRPLPAANRTLGKNKDLMSYYTPEIKKRALYVFGPFFEKYNYSFPESWGENKPTLYSRLIFKLALFLRNIREDFFITKNHKSLKGTIYGDIQRNEGK